MGQSDINTNGYLLKVDELKTYFPIKKGLLQRTMGYVKAVDGAAVLLNSPTELLAHELDFVVRENNRSRAIVLIHDPALASVPMVI